MSRAAFREKPLALKRHWRVSRREDGVPLETCERGGDEADEAGSPTEAAREGCPPADGVEEGTSLPEATLEL